MELNRVLVGVDFSEQSDLALRIAMGIARRFGSELHLVHVCHVPEWPAWLDRRMEDTTRELNQRMVRHMDEDRRRFREIHEQLDGQGVEISQTFREGPPAWGLVGAAETIEPDLIVLGSRGLGRMQRLLLGSVAERVARRARCSVLVLRGIEEPVAAFDRVLIGTDFAAPALKALEFGQVMAAADATLDLVNCWRIPGTRSWNDDPENEREEADPTADAIHDQVEEAGENWMAEKTGAGVALSFHLVNQTPVRGLREWIRANDCDLLVLGSHGEVVEHRPVLGDVAGAMLRRAPCSVLIAR